MQEMLKLKRECFRSQFSKQSREDMFKKKRYSKLCQLNSSNPLAEELNQLHESIMNADSIYQKINETFREFELFPERNIQLIAQLKILCVKLVLIEQNEMNRFFMHIQYTFLPHLIRYCDPQYSEDPTTVELTNYSLWIIINLSLADNFVHFIVFESMLYKQILKLFYSKYEVIVVRVLELLHNIIVEPQAEVFEFLMNDDELETSLIYRMNKKNPNSIMNAAGQCVADMCQSYDLVNNESCLPKILMFAYYCIPNELTTTGLIDLIQPEMAAGFLIDFRALCMKIVTNPSESINILNYFSSLSDEVLEALTDYPLVEELIRIRHTKCVVKVYQTLVNLASYHPFHSQLRCLLMNVHSQYLEANQSLKIELSMLVSNYAQECQATEYAYLIQQGAVATLVDTLRDIYQPNVVESALKALQCLFINEHAKQLFMQMGGPRLLDSIDQNPKFQLYL